MPSNRRFAPLPRGLLAGMLALAGGCAAPGPTAREAAETGWNQQRAKLKYELASAELKKGRTSEALTLAQGAVGLSPHDPAHAELLARVYMAKGDFAAARDVLLAVRRSAPGTANAAYVLGTIYEREQRWADAIREFETAASLRPELLSCRLALAAALAQSGAAASAIAALPEADERFGGEPAYHAARAEVYRRLGQLEAACAAYQRALQLGGRDLATRQALGLCLYWLGRHAESLPYLDAVARAELDIDPAAMTAYAGALLATSQPDSAAEWLERFTTSRPELGELWLLLAQARLAIHDVPGAVQAGARALTLLPRSGEALGVVAAVRLAAGDVAGAETCVAQALAIEPADADALLLRGRIGEERGDKAAAAAAYRAALKAEPDNVLARELLAGLGG